MLSCVWFFSNPWTRLFCPWISPGKNTWVAILLSRGSPQPQDQIWISLIAGSSDSKESFEKKKSTLKYAWKLPCLVLGPERWCDMFLASKSCQGTDTQINPLQFSSKLSHHPGWCKQQRQLETGSSSGTSLVVQWLRLCTPSAGGQGLIPGQGARSHTPKLKFLYATTKTRYS